MQDSSNDYNNDFSLKKMKINGVQYDILLPTIKHLKASTAWKFPYSFYHGDFGRYYLLYCYFYYGIAWMYFKHLLIERCLYCLSDYGKLYYIIWLYFTTEY